jgi:Raf kinase inhibitor-like YbhB/YbcL family protein
MRRILICSGLILLLAGLRTASAQAQQPPGLTLTTPAFADGSEIPQRYTQHDPNHPISPKLQWTNVPDGTASFVLILHDPEVATDKTTVDSLHWIVFNIPGTVREMAEGIPRTAQLPDGTIQPKNPRGHYGYRGPGAASPPHHHYTFELFALDTRLDLGTEATRAEVMKALDGHILAKALYVGRYYRH